MADKELAQDVRLAELVRQLDCLPDEVFERLQYLQPEIGCLNSCSFCSQEAGSKVWQLDHDSLSDLITAIGVVTRQRSLKVGSGRTAHRAGVIFPYLDNDCFSYPYLDLYLQKISSELGVKVRVATVGFSRHNAALMAMHERIVSTFADVFAGIRLSFTPYTAGFAATGGSKLSRSEFEADVANLLRMYRSVFTQLGYGKTTACVEIRFHPDVRIAEVIDTIIDEHHLISAGPHVLVSKRQHALARGEPTRIRRVINGVAEYTQSFTPYLMVSDQRLVSTLGSETIAEHILSGDAMVRQELIEVPVFQFENSDGPYFVVSPDFKPDGQFHALHIYPRTQYRGVSGYNNATRYFLNALLGVKAQLGYARREKFASAQWDDVFLVIEMLKHKVEDLKETDVFAALHVQQHVIPLVESYVRVLQLSGYGPAIFFDPDFTIDTGQIVNQGRAKKYFLGLVNREEEPVTPREARAFGDDHSISAQRGKVWRITPVPYANGTSLSPHEAGGKAVLVDTSRGAVVVHEVSENTLRPIDHKTGLPLRLFVVHGLSTEVKDRRESWHQMLVPGAIRR